MMIDYKKMNLKKILVILVLLVSCYTLFNVSYKLVEGTDEAEAQTTPTGGMETDQEAQDTVTADVNQAASLAGQAFVAAHNADPKNTKIESLNLRFSRDMVTGAHIVHMEGLDASGDFVKSRTMSGKDFSNTGAGFGFTTHETVAHKPTNSWWTKATKLEFRNFTNKAGVTSTQLSSTSHGGVGDVKSTEKFIVKSSDAAAIIANLPKTEKEAVAKNMVLHPDSAVLVTTRLDPATGLQVEEVLVGHYKNGKLVEKTVAGVTVAATADDIMHPGGHLAGKGEAAKKLGIEAEFTTALTDQVNNNIGNATRIAELYNLDQKELGSGIVVQTAVNSTRPDFDPTKLAGMTSAEITGTVEVRNAAGLATDTKAAFGTATADYINNNNPDEVVRLYTLGGQVDIAMGTPGSGMADIVKTAADAKYNQVMAAGLTTMSEADIETAFKVRNALKLPQDPADDLFKAAFADIKKAGGDPQAVADSIEKLSTIKLPGASKDIVKNIGNTEYPAFNGTEMVSMTPEALAERIAVRLALKLITNTYGAFSDAVKGKSTAELAALYKLAEVADSKLVTPNFTAVSIVRGAGERGYPEVKAGDLTTKSAADLNDIFTLRRDLKLPQEPADDLLKTAVADAGKDPTTLKANLAALAGLSLPGATPDIVQDQVKAKYNMDPTDPSTLTSENFEALDAVKAAPIVKDLLEDAVSKANGDTVKIAALKNSNLPGAEAIVQAHAGNVHVLDPTRPATLTRANYDAIVASGAAAPDITVLLGDAVRASGGDATTIATLLTSNLPGAAGIVETQVKSQYKVDPTDISTFIPRNINALKAIDPAFDIDALLTSAVTDARKDPTTLKAKLATLAGLSLPGATPDIVKDQVKAQYNMNPAVPSTLTSANYDALDAVKSAPNLTTLLESAVDVSGGNTLTIDNLFNSKLPGAKAIVEAKVKAKHKVNPNDLSTLTVTNIEALYVVGVKTDVKTILTDAVKSDINNLAALKKINTDVAKSLLVFTQPDVVQNAAKLYVEAKMNEPTINATTMTDMIRINDSEGLGIAPSVAESIIKTKTLAALKDVIDDSATIGTGGTVTRDSKAVADGWRAAAEKLPPAARDAVNNASAESLRGSLLDVSGDPKKAESILTFIDSAGLATNVRDAIVPGYPIPLYSTYFGTVLSPEDAAPGNFLANVQGAISGNDVKKATLLIKISELLGLKDLSGSISAEAIALAERKLSASTPGSRDAKAMEELLNNVRPKAKPITGSVRTTAPKTTLKVVPQPTARQKLQAPKSLATRMKEFIMGRTEKVEEKPQNQPSPTIPTTAPTEEGE